MKKLFSLFAAFLFVGTMWATDVQVKITRSSVTSTGSMSYGHDYNWSQGDIAGKLQITANADALQFNSSKPDNGTPKSRRLWNTTETPGRIKSITIKKASGSDRNWKVCCGKTAATSSSEPGSYGREIGSAQSVTTEGATWNVPNDSNFTYFMAYESGSGACYIDTIEVVYEAEDPTTCATPTFSPTAGAFLNSQNVTISCATENAAIYYTKGDNPADPTTSSTLYEGPIAVSSTTTIKAIAVKAGLDNSAIASASYTKYSVDHVGTEGDPYSISDAYTAIDAGVGITGVYAKGIVSRIVTALSYGKISYSISADGLTTSDSLFVYNGKNIDGANFTSADQIRVGDELIVTGNLKKYEDTYEFEANNELVSYVKRTPKFTIANVGYLAVGDPDLAVSGLTVTKEGDGVVTLASSSNEAVATIEDGKIHAVSAGDVTITANLAADGGTYRANTTTFNVHVIVPCTNFLTLSKGTPEHGSFTINQDEDKYPTCDEGLTVVVTPTADTHYHVTSVSAPNSYSISGPTAGKYTVTYAQNTNASSEINVTFTENDNSLVTWNVNGATSTTKVYHGEKPVFPATPSAFDAISTTFVGWADAPWSGSAANLNEKTVYTKASAMPDVEGPVTYYAVFAKVTVNGTVTITNSDFTGVLTGSYATKSITKQIESTNYTFEVNACKQNDMCQMRDNATVSYIAIPTLPGVITNLSTSVCSAAGTDGYTGTLHFKSSKTRGNSDTDDIAKVSYSGATSFNWFIEGNISDRAGWLVTNAGLRLKDLTVTYGEYSAFVTTSYAVTFTAPSNGTLKIYEENDLVNPISSNDKFVEGTQFIVDAQPTSSYKLDGVVVTKTSDGSDVPSAVYNEGILTMPAYGVTVSASFSQATALEDVETSVKAVKVLRNGQLFIEKAGKVYTITGQLVK